MTCQNRSKQSHALFERQASIDSSVVVHWVRTWRGVAWINHVPLGQLVVRCLRVTVGKRLARSLLLGGGGCYGTHFRTTSHGASFAGQSLRSGSSTVLGMRRACYSDRCGEGCHVDLWAALFWRLSPWRIVLISSIGSERVPRHPLVQTSACDPEERCRRFAAPPAWPWCSTARGRLERPAWGSRRLHREQAALAPVARALVLYTAALLYASTVTV